MVAPLTLQLLGGASIEGPDGPITGRATQTHRLALLALLAATPRGMSRDKIVALLWPERDAPRARHALSDSIYRINKALAAEVVVANGGRDLRLDSDALPSDLTAFRRALAEEEWERAVEVYGGPFLDGLHLPDSLEFERWLEGERRRLAGRYAEALEALARERADDGDAKGAVVAWRRRASLDRYDARVTLRLMEALAAAGNPVAALRRAEAHAELLEREFGTGPDPEVAALAERIRGGAGSRPSGPPTPEGQLAPEAPPASGEATSPPSRSPATRDVEASSSGASQAPTRRPWMRIGVGAGSTLAVILAGTLVFDVPASLSSPRGDGAPVVMAVLSFEDLSPQGDRSWFADGIAEQIARTLDEVPGIEVIGPRSSFMFRARDIDLRRIADTLGVDFLVAGSLRSGGDSVWISPELIEGTTGVYRWSDTYATSLSSERLNATQRRIARDVAAALSLRVAAGPEPAEDAVADRAFEAYHEGRAVLRSFQSGAVAEAREVLTSIDYFEEVVDLEPRWADGWAGLGEAHHWAAYAGFDRGRHWVESKRALERALLLDPDHPQANASLGFVVHRLDHDPEVAERRLQRALALDTRQYWHCGYSFFLLWVGRYEEAVEAARRAEAHNPMSWRRAALTVSGERCAGRYEEAIRGAERVLSEQPAAAGTRRDLALALERTGRTEEALEALEDAPGGGAYLDLVRVLVLARGGRADEAELLLRRTDLDEATRWAAGWYPVNEVTAAPLQAAALVALGRREAAVEVLRTAMHRDPDTLIYDRCYPELRTLEGDVRYQELLRRTGVPES